LELGWKKTASGLQRPWEAFQSSCMDMLQHLACTFDLQRVLQVHISCKTKMCLGKVSAVWPAEVLLEDPRVGVALDEKSQLRTLTV